MHCPISRFCRLTRVVCQLWSPELVSIISSHPLVERVEPVGTIFALEFRASGAEAGYVHSIFYKQQFWINKCIEKFRCTVSSIICKLHLNGNYFLSTQVVESLSKLDFVCQLQEIGL